MINNKNKSDSIKWLELLHKLRNSHSDQAEKVVLLNKNSVAEDIVMGWVGAVLYDIPPGLVMKDYYNKTVSEQIMWLWKFINMAKAVQFAQTHTTASTMLVIDALNWLINQGVIYPDGSITNWANQWKKAKASSLMATELTKINRAKQIEVDVNLSKLRYDQEVKSIQNRIP